MISTFIADGLQSLATRLGTSADKGVSSEYTQTILADHQIEAAFRSSWVVRKTVMVPSLDATRKWRQWSGDQSEKIEEVEDSPRIRAKKKVYHAHWKARLYGGSAILIGTRDADLSAPIDIESFGVGDLKYLTVLTRHDLDIGELEDDPRLERFGLPRDYHITTTTGARIKLDPSRLVVFTGDPQPRWNVSGLGNAMGWGESVLQGVYDSCRNLDTTMANIAGLVFDAKTDVIKVPDLTKSIVDPKFEEMLIKRFATARMLKGNHGTLLLDAEEEYESKSYSFGGLDSIADRFMQVCSGAADIPMTRLLGTSPGGLNSTGDGDLNNYYDRVASMQSLELEDDLATLDQLLIRSAGADPESHGYEWKPLRQMTEKERSEIRGKDAETVTKLAASRVYPDEAVAEVGAKLFQENGVDQLIDQHADDDHGDDPDLDDLEEQT